VLLQPAVAERRRGVRLLEPGQRVLQARRGSPRKAVAGTWIGSGGLPGKAIPRSSQWRTPRHDEHGRDGALGCCENVDEIPHHRVGRCSTYESADTQAAWRFRGRIPHALASPRASGAERGVSPIGGDDGRRDRLHARPADLSTSSSPRHGDSDLGFMQIPNGTIGVSTASTAAGWARRTSSASVQLDHGQPPSPRQTARARTRHPGVRHANMRTVLHCLPPRAGPNPASWDWACLHGMPVTNAVPAGGRRRTGHRHAEGPAAGAGRVSV